MLSIQHSKLAIEIFNIYNEFLQYIILEQCNLPVYLPLSIRIDVHRNAILYRMVTEVRLGVYTVSSLQSVINFQLYTCFSSSRLTSTFNCILRFKSCFKRFSRLSLRLNSVCYTNRIYNNEILLNILAECSVMHIYKCMLI